MILRRLFSNTSIRHDKLKWHDLSNAQVSTINLNNLLNIIEYQPERLRLKKNPERIALLQLLGNIKSHIISNTSTDGSTHTSDTSSTSTIQQQQNLLEDIMVGLNVDCGVEMCSDNEAYLKTLQSSLDYIGGRDMGSFKFKDKIMGVAPSAAFEENMNRLIVSMDLSNSRNQRLLIEQILLESVFSFSSNPANRKSTNDITTTTTANSGSNTSSSSFENSLRDEEWKQMFSSCMVGIHADYTFKYLRPEADTLQLRRNTFVNYLTTPHFNLKTYSQNEITSDAYGNGRALCCVFVCDISKYDYKRVFQRLVRSSGILNLASCQGYIDPSSPADKCNGKYGKEDKLMGIRRPVNVIITNGLRWHFSRFYPYPSSRQMQSTVAGDYSAFEYSDLATMKYLYAKDDNSAAAATGGGGNDTIAVAIDKYMEIIKKNRKKIITDDIGKIGYMWQDGVFDLGANDIEHLIGGLQWWIRGFNVPTNNDTNV